MNQQTPIRLARHFEVFLEDQIAAGKFVSIDSAIEEGLRLLERREARLDELRAALIEGEQSGPATPLDFDEIKRLARDEAGIS